MAQGDPIQAGAAWLQRAWLQFGNLAFAGGDKNPVSSKEYRKRFTIFTTGAVFGIGKLAYNLYKETKFHFWHTVIEAAVFGYVVGWGVPYFHNELASGKHGEREQRFRDANATDETQGP